MFEYLKFSLTVRCYSNSMQNSLEVQRSSWSCLVLLPLSHSHQKIIPSSVLRHGPLACASLVYSVSGCTS